MYECFSVPNIKDWPRILIGFNDETSKFHVLSADTMCGFFVHRNEMVGDYRNFGEVLDKILDPIDFPIDLLVEESAQKEINALWEMNIVLF